MEGLVVVDAADGFGAGLGFAQALTGLVVTPGGEIVAGSTAAGDLAVGTVDEVEIVARERVSAKAVGLPGVLFTAVGALSVDLHSNRLKVKRVNAVGMAAEVVNDKAQGNRPHEGLV